MEIVPLSTQPWHEAPDRAQARQIVAPNNSRCTTHSLAQIRVPAGVSVRPHRHRRSEEVYHVVAGRGRMRLDGEEALLGPGDTVVIRVGSPWAIPAPPPPRPPARPPPDLEMLVTCGPAWEEADQVFD